MTEQPVYKSPLMSSSICQQNARGAPSTSKLKMGKENFSFSSMSRHRTRPGPARYLPLQMLGNVRSPAAPSAVEIPNVAAGPIFRDAELSRIENVTECYSFHSRNLGKTSCSRHFSLFSAASRSIAPFKFFVLPWRLMDRRQTYPRFSKPGGTSLCFPSQFPGCLLRLRSIRTNPQCRVLVS
jgi:hypothetical protein